ncbi:MAG: hypothetical protein J6T14_08035 [Clostridia bacterium]|nr:hypothetical protein [Clostridia bacterium]
MKNKYLVRLTAALTELFLVLSLAGCSKGENEEAAAAPDTAQTTLAAPEASEKKAAPEKEKAEKDNKESGIKESSEKEKDESKKSTAVKKASAKAATQKKTSASKKASSTTKKKTTAASPTRSLIARTVDVSTTSGQNLINSAVSFGANTIKFLTGRDPGIEVQVRSKTNATGGVQLLLYVKNKTGRTIRLNGYSSFGIKDLLGEEVLTTNIRLNEPVVLKNQEDTWLSVTLPQNWLASDELRQITLEAGIFSSTIALDYDLL